MSTEFKNEVDLENEESTLNAQVTESDTENEQAVLEQLNDSGQPDQVANEPEIDTDFTPIQIGETDPKKSVEAFDAYTDMLQLVDTIKTTICQTLKIEQLDIETLFDFFRNSPERWIYLQYIERNPLSNPDYDIERIIELKLIRIEGLETLVNLHKKFITLWEKIRPLKTKFTLRQLIDNSPEKTDLLLSELDKKYSRFTETKQQTLIVGKLNQIAELLNDLNEMNIVRAKNGPTEINLLGEYFDISDWSNSRPFVVTDVLFYRHRLQGYRTKNTQFEKPLTLKEFLE